MYGLHLMMDAVATRNLANRNAIVAWLEEVASLTGMGILGIQAHLLPTPLDNGPGVSVISVIAEAALETSHIAIHTWVDEKVVTADFYSCLNYDVEPVLTSFKERFGVTFFTLLQTVRRFGLSTPHVHTVPATTRPSLGSKVRVE